MPLCREPNRNDWPEHLVCEHYGHVGEDILQRIIMQDSYKYTAAFLDGDELYDLQEDPFEETNLIDLPEYADVQLELRRRLIDHIEETNDKMAFKIAYALKQGR